MKAQVVTFDVLVSLLFFLLLITLFIGVLFLTQSSKEIEDLPTETRYVFENMETNLKMLDQEIAFVKQYRVEKDKLDAAADRYGTTSIDEIIIGHVSGTHGIGLDPEAYDTCLYFVDTDGSTRIPMGTSGINAFGSTKTQCSDNLEPCAGYDRALTLFRPVLYDVGDVDENRIIRMEVVLCER